MTRCYTIESLESRRLLTLESFDLNTVRQVLPEPDFLTAVGQGVFFAHTDAYEGKELWYSDGTEAGTRMVRNIRKGYTNSSNPTMLTNVGGVLFFSADDGVHGAELWKTDGTAAGTVLVKDIRAGSTGSAIDHCAAINGILYFQANDGIHQSELWRSDGTGSGTYMVKEIAPGASLASSPREFTFFNGHTFFRAANSTFGSELWRTDGTEAGTAMVADIQTGSSGSSPTGLVSFEDYLYFTAATAAGGAELWKTDGTSLGTTQVIDLNPGSGDASPATLTPFNGRLYFSANDGALGTELFSTDGTASGTERVIDLNSGSASSFPGAFKQYGDYLFFAADNGVLGRELWRSDGTILGSVLVADILSGASGSNPTTLTIAGAAMYLTALRTNGSRELFKHEGATTSLVWSEPLPSLLTPVGSLLFFRCRGEVLVTDGTTSGTRITKDIWPSTGSSNPSFLTVSGDLLYFAANSSQLWKSDGTSAGTQMVLDGIAPTRLTDVNGTLYFVATSPTEGAELWKSDGTVAGTVMVKAINPGTASSSSIDSLTNANGTLYFTAFKSGFGIELWKSDGTAGGTVMVKDINPAAQLSGPLHLTPVGDRLFFSHSDGTLGREPWVTDGTSEGTLMLKDLRGGFDVGGIQEIASSFAEFNGLLYFRASSNGFTSELWRSDGTVMGTVLLKSFPAWGNPRSGLTVTTDRLFFTAADDLTGTELYSSDGTTAGTGMVLDIHPGSGSSIPSNWFDFNGRLFVAADTPATGRELWISDGSPEGTRIIKDTVPGPASPPAYTFAQGRVVNNVAYFRHSTQENGVELWRSDGTEAGTFLMADIRLGAATSDLSHHAVFGSASFFAADDGIYGRELYRFTVDQSPPAVLSSALNLDLETNVRVTFDQEVSLGTTATADLIVFNRTSNEHVSAIDFTLLPDRKTIVFSLPNLSDGNYSIHIDAESLLSISGLPISEDPAVPNAFVFSGDANRDRNININDFAVLASRFNLPGTFSQGDFNYNGTTEIGDFAILASKFNTTLAPPAFARGSVVEGLATSYVARSDARWNDFDAAERIDLRDRSRA